VKKKRERVIVKGWICSDLSFYNRIGCPIFLHRRKSKKTPIKVKIVLINEGQECRLWEEAK